MKIQASWLLFTLQMIENENFCDLLHKSVFFFAQIVVNLAAFLYNNNGFITFLLNLGNGGKHGIIA